MNGKRATRARFPNPDAPIPFLYATGGELDHALIKECWGRAKDAQINVVPQWKFFNQWNTVTQVDTKTNRLDGYTDCSQSWVHPEHFTTGQGVILGDLFVAWVAGSRIPP